MPLHPDDVVRKTFGTTTLRRGYNEDEVDAFLEEVVIELRRLRQQVDEDQAEIDRLQREVAAGGTSRLAAEERQLEQVRRERDALAAELRDADQRIAQAREEIAQAEADRDARFEQIRTRYEEDLVILKKRAREGREEARQLAEEARQEEETVATRLAELRAEAEAVITANLGQDRATELLAGLPPAEASDPLADLRVVTALAETVHWSYIERGRTEAQEIRAAAEAEGERIIADATRRSEELLETARQQYEELLQAAQQHHDERSQAQAEHDPPIADGQNMHDGTVNNAADQQHRTLAPEVRADRADRVADFTIGTTSYRTGTTWAGGHNRSE